MPTGKGHSLIHIIEALAVLVAVAFLVSSCRGSQKPGPQPFGVLIVNGPAANGGVELGGVRIYTLAGIIAGDRYLVRTSVAPGGILQASVYTSLSAYKTGVPPLATATAVAQDNYEIPFTATETGDYVVVLSGIPSSTAFNTLSFFNLRVMSASVLSTFETPTVTASPATATGTVFPDSFVVYSGATITPPGTYSILLTSSTLTISYPQMFIYADDSLSLGSLLYSVIASSTSFTVYSGFQSGGTPTTIPLFSTPSSSSTVTSVTFTGGGPFILLRGVSQATFTLEVSLPTATP